MVADVAGTFGLGDGLLIEVSVLELGILAPSAIFVKVPEYCVELPVIDLHAQAVQDTPELLFVNRAAPIPIKFRKHRSEVQTPAAVPLLGGGRVGGLHTRQCKGVRSPDGLVSA